MHDKWFSEHIHALSGRGLSAHAAGDHLGGGLLTFWRREEADAIFLVAVKRNIRCMVILVASVILWGVVLVYVQKCP